MSPYLIAGTGTASSTANLVYTTDTTSSATDWPDWDTGTWYGTNLNPMTRQQWQQLPGIRAGSPGQLTVQTSNVRQPPSLEFNRYINASDLLEEFIRWLGEQGVRHGEVFNLPLEHFIKWLILRACEEDEEEPNVELPALPAPKKQPRCLGCQKFMPWAILLPLHGAKCAEIYFARQKQHV